MEDETNTPHTLAREEPTIVELPATSAHLDGGEDSGEEDFYGDMEQEERVTAANAEKDEGNRRYAEAKYKEAAVHYTQALRLAPPRHPSRAIFFSNRAACRLAEASCPEHYQEVISDTTEALRIDPAYVKALMRRAQAYEATDKPAEALKDYEAALALDPSLKQAQAAKERLPAAIKEQQQREQDKMIGQLKDLGNSLLGKFGLSLDQFKMEKDPASGGYSVKFS